MRLASYVLVGSLLSTTIARADDPAATAPAEGTHAAAEVEDEHTAAEVEDAPVPGEESGRLDHYGEGESTARGVGRVLLWVPRTMIEVAFLPARGAAWAYDRFRLPFSKHKVKNQANTIGLSPTLSVESNYGVTLGARFVHRDLFGEREHLTFKGARGGRYRSQFGFELRSGERFGERVGVALRGELDQRPNDLFWGIGNIDDAIKSTHRQAISRVSTVVDVRAVDHFHVRTAAAITELDYGPGDSGIPLEMAYDPRMATGYTTGMENVYGELELSYDSRRRASAYDANYLPATGSLATVYGGRVHQLGVGDDYWRTGFALQRFIWAGAGPRVLALRLQGEAVTGDYDDVAFTELPQLGGKMLLRGYPTDRFRDRAAALSTVEYLWDLNKNLVASLFVDTGRVFPSVADLTVDNLRVGYGAGLQIVTRSDFIAELSVASSIDGGLYLNLAFDPVFDVDPRVVRR